MANKEPKEIKIIAGGYEMTMASPEIIERVIKQWKADHPGCAIEDMPPGEFADRMMKAMYASAVKLQTGTA